MCVKLRVALVALASFAQLSMAASAHGGGNQDGDRDGHRPGRVEALFGLDSPNASPFPSDRFTVADDTQNTCERVNLPVDCTVTSTTQPNDCVEIGLLNQLDGFNIRPRIGIPFSGPIDLSTANSATIFLVSLGNAVVDGVPGCLAAATSREDEDEDDDRLMPQPDAGWVVGIDQGIWDPTTNKLYVEAAEPLVQHTRYALLVTTGVKDLNGLSVTASKDFERAIRDDRNDDDHSTVLDPGLAAYEMILRRAVRESRFFGIRRRDLAAVSVFSTMSVTSTMEKIHSQIAGIVPARADFKIGPNGSRTVFNLNAITALAFNRQVKVTGALSTTLLTPRLATLRLVPGAIAQMSSAKFQSPRYLLNRILPNTGTFSGAPVVQVYEDVFFTLWTPSGIKPAGGWPVVIFGHGSGDNVYGGPLNAASELAAKGFATIAINFVGNGFGATSTLTVTRTAADGGAMTFSSGGRGVDVNGDGNIDAGEGAQQGPPIGILLGNNASKQSVIDVLQLVQVIKAGVDIDGDGSNDIDGARQYYSGFSLGSFVGVLAFALEPQLRAATFTGIGGWPQLWFQPASRGALGAYLQNHLPSLINPGVTPGVTNLDGIAVGAPFFDENLPAPGHDPIVNTVAGAIGIQGAWEKFEWLSNTSMPGAYATHLRMSPLPGSSRRPFLIQIARDDANVPNPQTAEFVRAGMFADRATLYRHDLFAQKFLFKNPHTFLIRTDNAVMLNIAIQAQTQIATFFQADGETIMDPDGAEVLFETPATFIPQDNAFIP